MEVWQSDLMVQHLLNIAAQLKKLNSTVERLERFYCEQTGWNKKEVEESNDDTM